MDSNGLIHFEPGEYPLQKMCGQIKVLLFLVFTVLTIATFDFRILLGITVLFTIALMSLKPNWKVLGVLMIVALGLNLINLILFYFYNPEIGAEFVGTSTVLFRFNEHFIMPAETLWYFVVRTLKVLAMFMVSLWLIFVTTPSQLAAGFNKIGMPYKIAIIFSIALRYLPNILQDYRNTSNSIQARGMELDTGKAGFKNKIKGVVSIVGPLVLVTFDKVNVIADALDLRGFGKNKSRTWYVETPYGKLDKTALALIIVTAAFTVFYIIYRAVKNPMMWYPF